MTNISSKNKNILLTTLGLVIISSIAYFFSAYQLNFHNPVSVKVTTPVTISKRVEKVQVVTLVQADTHNSPLNAVQQMICDTFGDQCKEALAIAKAESNYNCNEINVNSNNSVDFGIFQENSVHLNKQFTFSDLASCQTQIEAAYKLYKAQGWGIWSSVQNKSYLKFMY